MAKWYHDHRNIPYIIILYLVLTIFFTNDSSFTDLYNVKMHWLWDVKDKIAIWTNSKCKWFVNNRTWALYEQNRNILSSHSHLDCTVFETVISNIEGSSARRRVGVQLSRLRCHSVKCLKEIDFLETDSSDSPLVQWSFPDRGNFDHCFERTFVLNYSNDSTPSNPIREIIEFQETISNLREFRKLWNF